MNLVTVSYYAKTTIKVVIAIIAIYLILLITKPITKKIFYAVFPPKDAPNYAYGPLQPLEFTPIVNDSEPTYTLNTKNGRLPGDFPQSMKVYKYVETPILFEAGRTAQLKANYLGYTDNEFIANLNDEIYLWRKNQSGANLKINTTTQTLEQNTSLNNKSSLYTRGALTESKAITKGSQILVELGYLTDTLYKDGSTQVSVGEILPRQIGYVNNPSKAHLYRIDYFRKVNEYPILNDNPKASNTNITIGEYIAKTNIIADTAPIINAYEWSLVPNDSATYPLIPIKQAWDAVSTGNGVITNITPTEQNVLSLPNINKQIIDQILINNIYIAYYDTKKPQQFMQPIYVFEGTYTINGKAAGSISIYYPALTNDSFAQPQPTEQ